ncbi:hypothetical protein BD809_10396 [Aquimarina intermedia]|uniref:Uncharacterized protein n=1 Tax=Aquimarina intermedia TaxID=350814 RepID=A0A5S5C6Q4_9FLAO|nr:hypothetical protein BD809_10396 [Aquimarina intermedia]
MKITTIIFSLFFAASAYTFYTIGDRIDNPNPTQNDSNQQRTIQSVEKSKIKIPTNG